MVINDHYRFIFIHVPKAAGTSLMQALQRLEGNNSRLLAATKHETLGEFMVNWQARSGGAADIDPLSYFRFAFVRNPWVRMHSFYTYLVEARPRPEIVTVKSFKDFLQQSRDSRSWINGLHSMRPQLDFFTTTTGEFAMDFVGHYEHLQDDLSDIGGQIGVEIQIPHLNKSSSSTVDYRERFDAEMIDIVTQRFAGDIERFGHVFDDPKPTRRCSGALKGA
jgi:hypothetical protein